MKVTARDIDMLRWINGHGFATIRQISSWMGTVIEPANGVCND